MKKCCIITAYVKGDAAALIPADSFILCADGGKAIADKAGISCDIHIADMDSSREGCPDILLPTVKDDTDTLACLKYAADHGFAEAVIIGGIGGRLDHTFANLQCLKWAQQHGIAAELRDSQTSVKLLLKGTYDVPCDKKFISLFAYSETADISISGAKYSGEHILIDNAMPLGVSNEPANDTAHIKVHSGEVLMILADERP